MTRLPSREKTNLEVSTLACSYQLCDFQPILIPPVPKCLHSLAIFAWICSE